MKTTIYYNSDDENEHNLNSQRKVQLFQFNPQVLPSFNYSQDN